MRHEFPGFDDLVRGQRVLDFGCGDGWQSVAMAAAGANFVVGVDTNEGCLSRARSLAAAEGWPGERLAFVNALPAEMTGFFSLVVSQNSFEHFPDPAGVLDQMKAALGPGGRILITFGPPWLAPAGSHMQFFTPLPWVNLLFSERTVMRVRRRFRDDGAERYEEVEGGLNKMTVARFEQLVRASGLRLAWKRYRCIRGLDALALIPGLRELCINIVSCVLQHRGIPPSSPGYSTP